MMWMLLTLYNKEMMKRNKKGRCNAKQEKQRNNKKENSKIKQRLMVFITVCYNLSFLVLLFELVHP
jgi:hypothetical protein